MISGTTTYAALTSDQQQALARRAARVTAAFAENPILCNLCDVRFRDYHAAVSAVDIADYRARTDIFTPPGSPYTLDCRHGNAATQCTTQERMRRLFDDPTEPIPFPRRGA